MTYERPKPGEPINLQVAGRTLEVKFTLKVLKQLSDEKGIKILQGLGEAMGNPSTMATVLFYGLKTKQPDLTEEWVEENFDASMLLDMAPMLGYACTGRWIKLPTEPGDLPNAMRPKVNGSPGLTFGPSEDTTSDAVKQNSGA